MEYTEYLIEDVRPRMRAQCHRCGLQPEPQRLKVNIWLDNQKVLTQYYCKFCAPKVLHTAVADKLKELVVLDELIKKFTR